MIYNKFDIYILDKEEKEVFIVEVGITSFDNLRTFEQKRNTNTVFLQFIVGYHGYKTKIYHM